MRIYQHTLALIALYQASNFQVSIIVSSGVLRSAGECPRSAAHISFVSKTDPAIQTHSDMNNPLTSLWSSVLVVSSAKSTISFAIFWQVASSSGNLDGANAKRSRVLMRQQNRYVPWSTRQVICPPSFDGSRLYLRSSAAASWLMPRDPVYDGPYSYFSARRSHTLRLS